MKNLQVIAFFILSIITLSCSKDDDESNDNNNNNGPAQTPEFQAEINGGTFSNYTYTIGVYEVIKSANNNTLSINTADSNGRLITLFLNETGGFSSSTVKEMGNRDSNDFTTFASIREQETQTNYFSTSGSVTITTNRVHPSETGHRLISGNFTIDASTADGMNSATMTGSFTELDYID